MPTGYLPARSRVIIAPKEKQIQTASGEARSLPVR
jgi:hypothetical protein